jgi:Uma2 family endonuclease
MAETDTHARCIIDARVALERYFADDPMVYVSGNLLMYYEQGNPYQAVAPDLFVVRGVAKRRRHTYRLWEEGKGPDFVVEFTSRSTRWEDQTTKRGLYELLGVSEYFLCDPLQEYLRPPFQGFRLVAGVYQPITPSNDGALPSEVVGLELRREDERLRFHDPVADRLLPTPDEETAARLAAEHAREEAEHARRETETRATAEAAARRRLEEEVARLRTELARRAE